MIKHHYNLLIMVMQNGYKIIIFVNIRIINKNIYIYIYSASITIIIYNDTIDGEYKNLEINK